MLYPFRGWSILPYDSGSCCEGRPGRSIVCELTYLLRSRLTELKLDKANSGLVPKDAHLVRSTRCYCLCPGDAKYRDGCREGTVFAPRVTRAVCLRPAPQTALVAYVCVLRRCLARHPDYSQHHSGSGFFHRTRVWWRDHGDADAAQDQVGSTV